MEAPATDAAAHTYDFPGTAALTAAEPRREGALNPEPALGDVLREQLGAVGLALRREGVVLAAVLGMFSAFVLWPPRNGFWLDPEQGIPAALLALLVPMAVGKGEGPGERGYHHAMPVEPAVHAWIRTAAGLAWTLAAMGAFFAWMRLLGVITGGGVNEAPAWRWAGPFAGAAVLYLLGSALTLVSSHPWRWLGGSVVGYVFLNAFRPTDIPWLPVDAVEALWAGRYGIQTVLTGLTKDLVWGDRIPEPGVWLASAAIWLTIAVGAFVVAAYRQPES